MLFYIIKAYRTLVNGMVNGSLIFGPLLTKCIPNSLKFRTELGCKTCLEKVDDRQSRHHKIAEWKYNHGKKELSTTVDSKVNVNKKRLIGLKT
jgi:hypothetical protein